MVGVKSSSCCALVGIANRPDIIAAAARPANRFHRLPPASPESSATTEVIVVLDGRGVPATRLTCAYLATTVVTNNRPGRRPLARPTVLDHSRPRLLPGRGAN